MKVLAVASEMHPFIKTGGLADVVGALPAALAPHGVEVRTLIPGYPAVLSALPKRTRVQAYPELFGAKAVLTSAKHGDTYLFILDCPDFFGRSGGPYSDMLGNDWPDNWRRFAALSAVAADIASGRVKRWEPDLIHAHDWQGAMSLAYARFGAAANKKRVIAIHNLAFQGRYGSEIFPDLGLPPEAWGVDGVEYYGGTGYLKAGLISADAITTVSPTYAREIRSPGNGMGLDGLLSGRGDKLHGILNGIDAAEWDPASDEHLAGCYNARSLSKRAANRKTVERSFNLQRDKSPLFIVISRLTWQKGMDQLAAVVNNIVNLGGKLALLGSGDHPIEGAFLAAAQRHPGRVGVRIGYDEKLSHMMQAGGDAILIPSRFEPCGLTQLYGLRYGCVPVAARVGGLADTIVHANDAALSSGAATGILFDPSEAGLMQAIEDTVALYADKPAWQSMQRAAMHADFSWHRSAARYAALFRSLVSE